jgi:hypothetical protein
VSRLAEEVLLTASEVEVLLLARKSPDKAWDAAAVRRRLRIGQAQAQETLARLASIGLLEKTGHGRYRYGPSTSKLSDTVDALAEVYGSHRLAILLLVFSRPKGPISDFPPAGSDPRSDGG